MNKTLIIEEMLEKSAEIKINMKKDVKIIEDIAKAIIEVYKEDKKVVFCGNGGSAADAQHLAAELVGRFKLERRGLQALALTTNTSIITAIGNDYGFEEVFARQVEALVNEGDIVIGISTSGNSPNVLKAVELAKKKGARTIGFTGEKGGKLGDLVDLSLKVPSNDTPRIQEAHITVGHVICHLVEEELFKK